MRRHAAWALGRIGTAEAGKALDARAAVGGGPHARDEIDAVLAAGRDVVVLDLPQSKLERAPES